MNQKELHEKALYEDLEIALNKYGHVDVEFYHQKAKAMQAAALTEMLNTAGKAISHSLHVFYEKYLCPKCSTAH